MLALVIKCMVFSLKSDSHLPKTFELFASLKALYKWWKILFISIVYKKTDEWYIERQRVTTNDNEWQRITTSDNEWQRVTTSGTKSDNQWQSVTTNSNEWQRVRAVVQRMKTAQCTSKNWWLPSFQWQKEIH